MARAAVRLTLLATAIAKSAVEWRARQQLRAALRPQEEELPT